jgi:hypothetical protein
VQEQGHDIKPWAGLLIEGAPKCAGTGVDTYLPERPWICTAKKEQQCLGSDLAEMWKAQDTSKRASVSGYFGMFTDSASVARAARRGSGIGSRDAWQRYLPVQCQRPSDGNVS